MPRLIDADAVMRLIPYEEFNARMAITNAPTIEAEPIRHGHWIMKPNGYGTCSNCNKCSLDIMGGVHSNFCPNCGAKMDEVSE